MKGRGEGMRTQEPRIKYKGLMVTREILRAFWEETGNLRPLSS